MTRIIPVPLWRVGAYLVKRDKFSLLIDTGMPGDLAKISRTLVASSIDMRDLKLIVVTHAHYDHVGSLAAVAEASGAPILAASSALPLLRQGFSSVPRGLNPFARLLTSLVKSTSGDGPRFASPGNITSQNDAAEGTIPIDAPRRLDEYGFPAVAVPLPGHTADSLGIILDSGEAFIGDAAFNLLPRSVVPFLADAPEQLLKSWRVLIESEARVFYPGHGRPFSRDKLMRSLPRLERLVVRMNR